MPDLNGRWWAEQKNSDISLQNTAESLLQLIKDASVVVKPGGHVYVFKFIKGNALIQKIIALSDKRGVFATAEMIMFDNMPGIHFAKAQHTTLRFQY